MDVRIPALAAGLAALLTACGLPEDADIAPATDVLSAPAPMLLPDATFRTALAEAQPAGARIEADAAILAARAEALAARAETLNAPVIEPADRARLEAASAGPGG